jgi:hypothetical protein
MKLDVAVNEIVLSNVGTTGEFRIRNSAKAFKILSDGLYSNKIRAIIRELSCNAVDSHVAAGKETLPFEVHLPSILEPWFSVRDFGLGLNGDQVVNIYTTYFESTKTDSNEFIGALGLGSKSPFSYTENFTVTAIKDGVQRIYSAFINEVGVPSIAEMSMSETDEPNGVEVKFSVTDRYDYQSFRNEAYHVFTWFKNKPNVTGVDRFEHRKVRFKEENIVPGVHVLDDSHECYAVMGNIAYPLNNVPEVSKHFGDLAALLGCGLVFEFQIGELDFAASREQLSYIPLTINSIKKKLEAVNANLAVHLAAKANAIECEWARAAYLQSEYRSRLYSAAVKKYVLDTKFELFDPNNYRGTKDFTLTIDSLTTRQLSISGFRAGHSGTSYRIGEHNNYVNGQYVKSVQIPVDPGVVIVLNDLKTGCVARARYHYCNNRGGSTGVYCVSHSDPDLTVRQKEYDKLIKELHNPPTIVKASELDVRERAKPMSTSGITCMRLKNDRHLSDPNAYTWMPYSEPIDEKQTYYYVCLSNHTPIDLEGNMIDVFGIQALMSESGVSEITNMKIFGVRKNRIKEIQELDNWVWFEEGLKKETAKVTDAHIASLVASEMLDTYYNRVYTSSTVAKLVGPDSDYHKYVKETGSIKRASGNVTQLVELCQKYGKSIQVEAVKKKIQDSKDNLYKKYPLLKYFKDGTSADEREIADYVKLVDNQEKENE